VWGAAEFDVSCCCCCCLVSAGSERNTVVLDDYEVVIRWEGPPTPG
jgi:hypothetical protein